MIFFWRLLFIHISVLWFTYGVRISWHLFLCKLIWLFIIVAVKCFFGVSDVAFCHTLILTVYLQYVTLYRAAEVRFCHMLFVNGLLGQVFVGVGILTGCFFVCWSALLGRSIEHINNLCLAFSSFQNFFSIMFFI